MQKEEPMDLIDRQAAIEALFELYEYQRDIDPTEAADLVRQGIFLAEKKIENLPSLQPEIVRCKDCKWYNDRDRTCNDPMGFGRYWKPDDFCSYGKRRADGTD